MPSIPKYSGTYQVETGSSPNSVAQRDSVGDLTAETMIGESGVQSEGHLYANAVSKTTNYTLTDDETTVLFDATSGALTATLPPASGCDGQIFFIQKTDSSANAVTIDPDSSETIAGLSSWLLYAAGDSVLIQSDGSNWVVLAHKERAVVLTKSTTFTVSSQPIDQVYICTVASGYTATLPTAASMKGVRLTFVKIDAAAAALTLDGASSETINDAATNTEIDAQFDTLTIFSDGSEWWIISRKIS